MKNKISSVLETVKNYLLYIIFKLFSKRPIRVYYWKGQLNFGDLITRDLLSNYGFKPIWFNAARAELISTGSLIEHLSKDFKGIILGTGAIDSNTKTKFLNAKIVALRGKSTKRNLGVTNPIVLGDPGLLADRLIKNQRSIKKFELGVIPHYSDYNNEKIKRIKVNNAEKIHIINVRKNPIDVLKEMDSCKHIISSSLHGLICSDSLGIPNRWIKLSQLLGNDFKFKDYYSVFDIEPQYIELSGQESIEELISKTELIDSEKMKKVKIELENQFLHLKK